MQVILMVASDAYEGRVMQLIRGKRELFDNVIDPMAHEDVVGVSRKLLEALVEDLAEPVAEGSREAPLTEAHADTPEPGAAAAGPDGNPAVGGSPDETTDQALRHCIETLQKRFGPRIERILGSGGGLLVVLDRVDAEADRFAAGMDGEIPVALIDPRTLHGLQRLGRHSPLAQATSHYEATGGGSPRSRQLAQAGERFRAAEVLLEQRCAAPAAELLVSALLASAAARADLDLDHPPGPAEAGVWLYGEALPKGWLTADRAALIMRTITLAQAAELPVPLLRELVDDCREFVVSAH